MQGSISALAGGMRDRGASVGLGQVLAAHRALAAVDVADPRHARAALRAALCSDREDLERFEAALGQWRAGVATAPRPADPVAAAPLASEVAAMDRHESVLDLERTEPWPAAWSDIELLADKDFADYTDRERAIATRVLAGLARRGPARLARRTRAVGRRRSRLDPRATWRASLRHAGEPVDRRWRQRRSRPRRLVVICDVSGSMAPYARMLLQYAQACVQANRVTEAFAFSTRLTRVTEELRVRDPDRALRRAAASAPDWAGGTLIGAAVAELNRAHGARVGRGAVVVLLSDGWDCGDPALLDREVGRLGRCAHRLVWLNPLKASPHYQPLARGMMTVIPHLDLFIAGNSLSSLAQLAKLMERGFFPSGNAPGAMGLVR